MVRRNGVWGTVCDDDFTQKSAKAACYTLGLSGGQFATRETVIGDAQQYVTDTDTKKIWMDNVKCASSTDNFLMCPHNGWGSLRDCQHWEDVFLSCT